MNLINRQDIIKRLISDYFRMIIFGSTASGKTHFLLNKLMSVIHPQYDEFVIFTLSHNKPSYLKKLQELGINRKNIIVLTSKFEEHLLKLIKAQKQRVIKFDPNTEHPIFSHNILIIWDDVLDEKLFKKKAFLDQFRSLRHIQASVIVVAQESFQSINTRMKANSQFFVIFKMNASSQRNELVKLLSEAADGDLDIAKEHYNKYVKKRKYGFIMTTEDGLAYIPTDV